MVGSLAVHLHAARTAGGRHGMNCSAPLCHWKNCSFSSVWRNALAICLLASLAGRQMARYELLRPALPLEKLQFFQCLEERFGHLPTRFARRAADGKV